MLALGSANQLKVSRPMSSASWEHTAAKLHQPHKELKFRSIAFSADGSMLAVLAGTSVFAHLCIYDVDQGDEDSPGAGKSPGRSPGKGGGRGGALCHVHEVHPSRSPNPNPNPDPNPNPNPNPSTNPNPNPNPNLRGWGAWLETYEEAARHKRMLAAAA